MDEDSFRLKSRDPRNGVLRFVQFTDTHLFADDKGKLLGLETARSLSSVVNDIRRLPPQDFMLATGDLAQDASEEAYRRLMSLTDPLATPIFWVPGNHDDVRQMQRLLMGKYWHPQKHLLGEHWQIILLNSAVPGKVHGQFSDDELARLERLLREHPGHHTLLVLHHQPVPVGCRWLDGIGLKNSAALFALLARYPNVKGILWGHVHQEFDKQLSGMRLMATPSTCVQFEPGAEDFSAGRQEPGYRQVELHPDGSIHSRVHRSEAFSFTVDYSIKGY
jgi:Icc protein